MEPKKESEKLNKALRSAGIITETYQDGKSTVNIYNNTNQVLQDKLDRLESYLCLPFLQMPQEEKEQLLRIIKE